MYFALLLRSLRACSLGVVLGKSLDKILMMEAHVFLLLSEFKKGEVPDWTSQPGLLG